MPKITYVTHDGKPFEVDAKAGLSLMEAAGANNVPGIDADCGGACACATCHIYIDGDFSAQIGESGDMEQSMLDFAEGVTAASRLACQITVTDELDGLTVSLPEAQH